MPEPTSTPPSFSERPAYRILVLVLATFWVVRIILVGRDWAAGAPEVYPAAHRERLGLAAGSLLLVVSLLVRPYWLRLVLLAGSMLGLAFAVASRWSVE